MLRSFGGGIVRTFNGSIVRRDRRHMKVEWFDASMLRLFDASIRLSFDGLIA